MSFNVFDISPHWLSSERRSSIGVDVSECSDSWRIRLRRPIFSVEKGHVPRMQESFCAPARHREVGSSTSSQQRDDRRRERGGRSGLLYRLAMMYYAAYLAVRARLYRADIALIDSGTTLYFALALLQVDC